MGLNSGRAAHRKAAISKASSAPTPRQCRREGRRRGAEARRPPGVDFLKSRPAPAWIEDTPTWGAAAVQQTNLAKAVVADGRTQATNVA